MDRPTGKSVVDIIRGVAGHTASGGDLAPQPPRTTRNHSEPVQIFPKNKKKSFFFLFILLCRGSILFFGKDSAFSEIPYWLWLMSSGARRLQGYSPSACRAPDRPCQPSFRKKVLACTESATSENSITSQCLSGLSRPGESHGEVCPRRPQMETNEPAHL